MPQPNPIDVMARALAEWAITESKQIAEAIKGGMAAPGAAQLSEQQKLEYYTRAFFNPDGSPNYAGRQKEAARMGPNAFADAYEEVIRAHPELSQTPETPEGAAQTPPATPPVAGPLLGG